MSSPSCGKFRSIVVFLRSLICLPDALAPVANDDSANGSRQRTDDHVEASDDSMIFASAATYPDASFVSLSSFNPATSSDLLSVPSMGRFLSLPSLGSPISIDFPRDVSESDNESTVSTELESRSDSEDDIQIIIDLITPPSRPVIPRPEIKSACMDSQADNVGVPYGVVPDHLLRLNAANPPRRLTKKFYGVSYGYYVGVMCDPAHFRTSIEHVSGARHFSGADIHTVLAWFNAQLDCSLVSIVP
ncbi:hypothetical protein K525DRAFT_273924 [Schizophyllum commune Loenen D]|nr:hypothetical protein K525DRAFT_273924 [Schizophyllum commune Loenen D]